MMAATRVCVSVRPTSSGTWKRARPARPPSRRRPRPGAPVKPADLNKAEVAPPLPRFEFGASDDFQLQQAMNHLKGVPVIASTKAVASNTVVPVVTKP